MSSIIFLYLLCLGENCSCFYVYNNFNPDQVSSRDGPKYYFFIYEEKYAFSLAICLSKRQNSDEKCLEETQILDIRLF